MLTQKQQRQADFIARNFQRAFDDHQMASNASVQEYFEEYSDKKDLFFYLCYDLNIDHSEVPKSLL